MFSGQSEELLQSGWVAERFGAAAVGHGECPAQVPAGQARCEIAPLEKLVEESGVETVTSANRVNHGYGYGGCAESAPVPKRNGSSVAHFDDDGIHLLCKPRESGFHVVSPEIFMASRWFGRRMST